MINHCCMCEDNKNDIVAKTDQIATLSLSLKSLQEHHEAQTRDWESKFALQKELVRGMGSGIKRARFALLQGEHLSSANWIKLDDFLLEILNRPEVKKILEEKP